MKVTFHTGETFSGPWTDDASITPEVVAYRRIRHDWVTLDKATGKLRANSKAFQPHRDSLSISVTLGDVAEEEGIDPEDMALGSLHGEYGLAAFTIDVAREIGFFIRRVPVSDDLGHAMMFAENSETGDCPARNRCRTLGKKMSPRATLIRPPPPTP